MKNLASLFAKRPTEALPQMGAAHPPLEDYFSIAGHYDPHTLITKNGELLQILKLSPAREMGAYGDIAMRDALRMALHKEIATNDYSIAIHSIRRREQVDIAKRYTNPFTKMVNDTWHKLHPLDEHYVNEIYVTLLKEGSGDELFNPARFGRSLFGKVELSARHTDLEIAATELQLTVENIIHSCKPYHMEKLGVYQKKGVQYSAPLNLLLKLIHLKEVEVPLDFTAFDMYLAANNIKFGSDALEINAPNQSKRFGAMLSLKEYRELSVDSIEEIAQLPAEFILTETADFIPAKPALLASQKRQKFLNISKDNMLRRTSGLNDMLESNQGTSTDFAQHQTTLFVVTDDFKDLNDRIAKILQTMNSMGLVLMREDLRLEDSFWGIHPGNFAFHKRLNPINAVRIGGFVQELGHLPAQLSSSAAPATIFKTRDGIPVFFHLPEGEANIFTALGGAPKENFLATHFIISQALHQETQILYLDNRGNAEVFIHALEGDYHTISLQNASFTMNPFRHVLSDEHRMFLHIWVEGLICGASGLTLSGQHDDHILSAIAELYEQPEDERNLRRFQGILQQKDEFLGKRLMPWIEGNSHSSLFDHEADTLSLPKAITGFNLAAIAEDKHSIASVVFYLLHRINEQAAKDTPLLIVINEASLLFANPLFGQRIGHFLHRLARRNVSVILASSDEANHQITASPSCFRDAESTLLLRTKPSAKEFYEGAGIPASEVQHSQLLEQGEALLHYHYYDYRVPLLLHRMQTLKPVFFASSDHIRQMRGLMREKGESIHQWLPAYLETLHHGKT